MTEFTVYLPTETAAEIEDTASSLGHTPAQIIASILVERFVREEVRAAELRIAWKLNTANQAREGQDEKRQVLSTRVDPRSNRAAQRG